MLKQTAGVCPEQVDEATARNWIQMHDTPPIELDRDLCQEFVPTAPHPDVVVKVVPIDGNTDLEIAAAYEGSADYDSADAAAGLDLYDSTLTIELPALTSIKFPMMRGDIVDGAFTSCTPSNSAESDTSLSNTPRTLTSTSLSPPKPVSSMHSLFRSDDDGEHCGYVQEPGWHLFSGSQLDKPGAFNLASLKNLYRFAGINVTSAMLFNFDPTIDSACLECGITRTERKAAASQVYNKLGWGTPLKQISKDLPDWCPAKVASRCIEDGSPMEFLDNPHPMLSPIAGSGAPHMMNIAIPIYRARALVGIAVLLVQGMYSQEIERNRTLRELMNSIALSVRTQV